MCTHKYTTCIVGGGPSGMMAAYRCANKNNNVILLEQNEKLGKKLFITGKGRCNVTNNCDRDEFFSNVVSNSKFLFSSINNFSNKDVIEFFNKNHCKLKVERGGRVFPEGDKAFLITDCFKSLLKKEKVDIKLDSKVTKINLPSEESGKFTIEYIDVNNNSKNKVNCDFLVLACGGYTYKSTGSDGFTYSFARKNDINIIDLDRGLVPLEFIEKDVKKIANLNLKNVGIKCFCNRKIVYEDFGEMTFASYGAYGPIILSLSSYINSEDLKNNKYVLSIDLKPGLSIDKLDKRLIADFSKYSKREVKTSFDLLLPKKLIPVFVERLDSMGIDTNKKASDVSKEDRVKIVSVLKNFTYTIKCKRSFDEAIITKGGIDVKEINPKTMEVKKFHNLYIVGESLDVDCLTGGFNITTAISTGACAGDAIKNLTFTN